jgi:hypothetical protein
VIPGQEAAAPQPSVLWNSGDLDITDGIFLLDALFRGSPGPPPPFDVCGEDPTADDLGCAFYSSCAA